MNAFEKWAKTKGMLIGRDENDEYKSLETRAHFATWNDARAPLVNALETAVTELEHLILKLEQTPRQTITLKESLKAITKRSQNE